MKSKDLHVDQMHWIKENIGKKDTNSKNYFFQQYEAKYNLELD